MNPNLSQPLVSVPNADPTIQPPADDLQSSATAPKPQPRLRCADRRTLLPAMPLEDLVAPEHLARTVWQFVQGLDLTPLLETIRSVEGRPGRPAIDPKLLVALWLYATIEGIGSARAVAWLCANHHGFRWLCGGVEVNYHTLADFRVAHLDFLDELLTHSVATLMEQDLVDLSTHHRQDTYTAVGAWRGQGESDRAVVCDRAQPAAGSESARGAGDARLGERIRKVKAGPAESAKGI